MINYCFTGINSGQSNWLEPLPLYQKAPLALFFAWLKGTKTAVENFLRLKVEKENPKNNDVVVQFYPWFNFSLRLL